MKRMLLTISIIFILIPDTLSSWDTTAAKYLPLKVGNVWVYRTYRSGYSWICYAYERYFVSGVQQYDGHSYFKIKYTSKLFNPICSTWNFPVSGRLFGNPYLRIDSATMNVYGLDTCFVDSLASSDGDTLRPCNTPYFIYCDTSTQSIFGYTKHAKTFIRPGFETYETMWYIEDFGFVRFHYNYPGPSSNDMTLVGCVLDGVVYGDTNSMVGLNPISSEVPERYSLWQNYPNPFNPVTKIKFSLPAPSKGGVQEIKLIVYNILGKEVASLIPPLWGGKEGLSPGTYEVEWDGTNYPSGVYFCQLTVSSEQLTRIFRQAIRMVLVK